MSELAGRAERIAAHLVAHALGVHTSDFDIGGRQSAVDFILEWPSGRRGALEVTLLTEPRSAAWQGMAANEAGRWPAPSGWETRLSGPDMPYSRTRQAVLKAVTLCDLLQVDVLRQLIAKVMRSHRELQWLQEVGSLRRTSLSPGIVLPPQVRTESIAASSADFASVVEGWLHSPHVPRRCATVAPAEGRLRPIWPLIRQRRW